LRDGGKGTGRFSGHYLYACVAQHDGCDGKLRRPGNGKVVRPNQQHVSNCCRLAISKHRKSQFRYAGKQQRWRSRLGFALAGSIRFANADPNSYRYIHANTDSNSYSHTDSHPNSYIYADTDSNSHSHTDSHPNSYNNTCADSHAYCDAYSNIDTYPQRHTKA
jgi:hypothetical protein